MSKKKKGWIIILGIVLLIIAAAATVYAVMSLHYQDRFYKNTSIAGTDCSDKTVQEVMTLLSEEAKNYTLVLKGRNQQTEQILGTDIDYTYDVSYVSQLKASQGYWGWLNSLFQTENFEDAHKINYDQNKLKTQLENSKLFTGSQVIAPEDAHIVADDTGIHIVESVEGTTLDKDKVLMVVQTAIENEETQVDLEASNCYVGPKVTGEDPEFAQILEQVAQLSKAEITYDFGYATEVVDGDLIETWIGLDEENKPYLIRDKVQSYLDTLRSKYDNFYNTRSFQSYYGYSVSVAGGEYGWLMTYDSECDALIQNIENGEVITREPIYYYQGHGTRTEDGIGSTYIEISISNQHMFYYRDGVLQLDTPVVTGNPNEGNATPTGLYRLGWHLTDQILRGEDYESPVDYWLNVMGHGIIGIHDANWRSEFGSNIYSYAGSHGCINTPPSAMADLYYMTEDGIPIIIY